MGLAQTMPILTLHRDCSLNKWSDRYRQFIALHFISAMYANNKVALGISPAMHRKPEVEAWNYEAALKDGLLGQYKRSFHDAIIARFYFRLSVIQFSPEVYESSNVLARPINSEKLYFALNQGMSSFSYVIKPFYSKRDGVSDIFSHHVGPLRPDEDSGGS